jgi:hypothetical protein
MNNYKDWIHCVNGDLAVLLLSDRVCEAKVVLWIPAFAGTTKREYLYDF